MFFRKKKKDVSSNPFYKEGNSMKIYIKCGKCGYVMEFKILNDRDLMVSYDGVSAYMIDKLYVCPKCYNQISVKAGFKGNLKPAYVDINGGKFVAKEVYEGKEGER
ncbi:MAG: hypothetical protein J7L34_08695 [Thermotogaceae bacterium]|nr:hypothetical protein [Thermotogaceae bacterium]